MNEQIKKKFIKNNGPKLPHTEQNITLHMLACVPKTFRNQLNIYLSRNLDVVSYYFIPLWIHILWPEYEVGFFLLHLKIYLSQFILYISFAHAAGVDIGRFSLFFSLVEKKIM